MNLTVAGWKEITDVGNMMKKDDTKRQGFIDPHALIKTENVITVMGLPGLIQRGWISPCNINILFNKYSVGCSVCLPSIPNFACWNFFVLVYFVFHWSLPVIIHVSDLIEILILYCSCWLCEWIWCHHCQTGKIHWTYSCL